VKPTSIELLRWRHNTQENDTQDNDTQHYYIRIMTLNITT
jgi:hypothetical protein